MQIEILSGVVFLYYPAARFEGGNLKIPGVPFVPPRARHPDKSLPDSALYLPDSKKEKKKNDSEPRNCSKRPSFVGFYFQTWPVGLLCMGRLDVVSLLLHLVLNFYTFNTYAHNAFLYTFEFYLLLSLNWVCT